MADLQKYVEKVGGCIFTNAHCLQKLESEKHQELKEIHLMTLWPCGFILSDA